MKYYIGKENGNKFYNILKPRKDIRCKDEKKSRVFIEAIWYVVRVDTSGDYYQVTMVHGGRSMRDSGDGQ